MNFIRANLIEAWDTSAAESLTLGKVILTKSVSQARENMPSLDSFIPLRERLLDILSGSDRTQAINQVAIPDGDPIDRDPAAELRDLMHELLSRGLADHGESVDYAALRASNLYDNFRPCTAKLRDFDPSALPDRNARLAFWINLYNTLVLDGVITLGVQRSVRERRAGIAFFRQAAYIVADLSLQGEVRRAAASGAARPSGGGAGAVVAGAACPAG